MKQTNYWFFKRAYAASSNNSTLRGTWHVDSTDYSYVGGAGEGTSWKTGSRVKIVNSYHLLNSYLSRTVLSALQASFNIWQPHEVVIICFLVELSPGEFRQLGKSHNQLTATCLLIWTIMINSWLANSSRCIHFKTGRSEYAIQQPNASMFELQAEKSRYNEIRNILIPLDSSWKQGWCQTFSHAHCPSTRLCSLKLSLTREWKQVWVTEWKSTLPCYR